MTRVRISGSIPLTVIREVVREKMKYGKGQHLKKLCVVCGIEKVTDVLNTNMCESCIKKL